MRQLRMLTYISKQAMSMGIVVDGARTAETPTESIERDYRVAHTMDP